MNIVQKLRNGRIYVLLRVSSLRSKAQKTGRTSFSECCPKSAEVRDKAELFVVYQPVIGLKKVLHRWQGTWSRTICAARVSSISGVIGIWVGPQTETVHILRKHPGIDLLSEAERGNEDEEAPEAREVD